MTTRRDEVPTAYTVCSRDHESYDIVCLTIVGATGSAVSRLVKHGVSSRYANNSLNVHSALSTQDRVRKPRKSPSLLPPFRRRNHQREIADAVKLLSELIVAGHVGTCTGCPTVHTRR